MADFNTRLQFDWLGKSDKLTQQAIQSVQFREGIAAGDRRNQMQRDLAEARNVLELRRQVAAQQQFERRHKIDEARLTAYNNQIALSASRLKNDINLQAQEADQMRRWNEWFPKLVNVQTPEELDSLRLDPGFNADMASKADEAKNNKRQQFANSIVRQAQTKSELALAKMVQQLPPHQQLQLHHETDPAKRASMMSLFVHENRTQAEAAALRKEVEERKRREQQEKLTDLQIQEKESDIGTFNAGASPLDTNQYRWTPSGLVPR